MLKFRFFLEERGIMQISSQMKKIFAKNSRRPMPANFVQKAPTQGAPGRYCWGSSERRSCLQRVQDLFFGRTTSMGVDSSKQRSWFYRGGRLCGILLIAAGLCYGGVLLADFTRQQIRKTLEQARILPIEHLEIRGNELVAKERIRSVAQIVEHTTGMLSIDPGQLERDLENIPWIRSVEVNRSWPAGVIIEVEEERPLALLLEEKEGRQQLSYMDEDGRAFLIAQPGDKIDFPVISGLSAIGDEGLRQQAFADVRTFLRKIGRNNPYLPVHSLSEIHLTEKGEIILYLVEYPFPIFFGSGDVKKKYWRLVQILKPLYKTHNGSKRIEGVAYIQMEYLKDKVLVATVEDK